MPLPVVEKLGAEDRRQCAGGMGRRFVVEDAAILPLGPVVGTPAGQDHRDLEPGGEFVLRGEPLRCSAGDHCRPHLGGRLGAGPPGDRSGVGQERRRVAGGELFGDEVDRFRQAVHGEPLELHRLLRGDVCLPGDRGQELGGY